MNETHSKRKEEIEKIEKLGKFLLHRNMLTKEQFMVAISYWEKENKPFAEILYNMKLLDEEDMLKILSMEKSTEYFPTDYLLKLDISPEALSFIPVETAEELVVIPIDYNIESDTLLVAVAYDQDLQKVKQTILKKTGVSKLELVLTFEYTIYQLIQRTYPKHTGEEVVNLDTSDDVYLGPESDEEAFPGIYHTGSVDELLFSEDEDTEVIEVSSDSITGLDIEINEEEESKENATIQGQLADLPLPDMLQLLGQNRKTCRITLFHDGEVGEIDMEDGEVVYVKYGDMEGESAFYEIVGWEDGYFEITTNVKPRKRIIARTLQNLLLDSMRILDEKRRNRES